MEISAQKKEEEIYWGALKIPSWAAHSPLPTSLAGFFLFSGIIQYHK